MGLIVSVSLFRQTRERSRTAANTAAYTRQPRHVATNVKNSKIH